MTIDVSNYLASEFYKAAVMQSTPVGATTAQAQAVAADKGISGAIMQSIGIMGFADAYNQVREIQEKQDNGLAGIAFGLMSFIYLLGAAIVLFYGSILLIARAISLVVLMITSAAAFATYLIPTLENTGYNWKTWSEALIRNAVFAPILMLFLWITLSVASAMKPIINGATLGAAQNLPADNAKALFGYFFILGLLFLSFKLSSKFSGFTGNALTSLALASTAAPLALGAQGLGKIYQNTAGSRFQKRSDEKDADIAKAHVQLGKIPITDKSERERAQKHLETLVKQKAALDKKASRSGNLANTTIGKYLAKQAGLPAPLSGAETTEGGYHGKVERKAKQVADTVSALYNKNRGDFEKAAQEQAADEEKKKREKTDEAKKVADAHNEAAKQLQSANEQRKAVANALIGATNKTGDSIDANGAPAQAIQNALMKKAAATAARDAAKTADARADEASRLLFADRENPDLQAIHNRAQTEAAKARAEATKAESESVAAQQGAISATGRAAALSSEALASQKALMTSLETANAALPENTDKKVKDKFDKALAAQKVALPLVEDADKLSREADNAYRDAEAKKTAAEAARANLASAESAAANATGPAALDAQKKLADAKLAAEEARTAATDAETALAGKVEAAEKAHKQAEPAAANAVVISKEAIEGLSATLAHNAAALHTQSGAPGAAPVAPPVTTATPAAVSGTGRGGGVKTGSLAAEDTKINNLRDQVKDLAHDLQGFGETVKHVTERYKDASKEYEEYRLDYATEEERARAVERSVSRIGKAAKKIGDEMFTNYQVNAPEVARDKATPTLVKIFGGNSIVANHAVHIVEDSQKGTAAKNLRKALTQMIKDEKIAPTEILTEADSSTPTT